MQPADAHTKNIYIKSANNHNYLSRGYNFLFPVNWFCTPFSTPLWSYCLWNDMMLNKLFAIPSWKFSIQICEIEKRFLLTLWYIFVIGKGGFFQISIDHLLEYKKITFPCALPSLEIGLFEIVTKKNEFCCCAFVKKESLFYKYICRR